MDSDFLTQHQRSAEANEQVKRYYANRFRKPLWREYIEVVGIALIAAILMRVFVVSAYRVSSASMEDSLMTGDYIFVNKLAYNYREPAAGDIIVFKYPLNRQRDYIKRVVALPGQTVEIRDKVVYVDGRVADIPPNSKNTDEHILAAELSNRDNFGPIQVPVGEFFVMGDNRDDSQDSRFWGFVPQDHILGKAVFVYWSWEPDPNPADWSFPYVHTLVVEVGSFLVNFPTSTRWERLFMAL